jgi:hypothetical protein
VIGTTCSYAVARQAAATRLGSKRRRTASGRTVRLAPLRIDPSWLGRPDPGGRVGQQRRAAEPVAVARPQAFPWNGDGDLQQPVCHFVGGVVSPILANIYLDKLDRFVEQTLRIPT